MTGLIFLVTGIAMMIAVGGRRDVAVGLFGIAFVAAAVWLNHHMTSSLAVSL